MYDKIKDHNNTNQDHPVSSTKPETNPIITLRNTPDLVWPPDVT